MKVEFSGVKVPLKLRRLVKKAAVYTLEHLSQPHKKVLLSVSFIDKEEMKDLNNRTRNIDKVTDVLSYPNFSLKPFDLINENDDLSFTGKNILIGDMAICLEKAAEQAIEYGVTTEEEVVKLVIHSMLHLMGFDHIKDEDFAVMNQEEEKIASKFYGKM